MTDRPTPLPSCSSCSAILQKTGSTHCRSAPDDTPPPAYCPAGPHGEAIHQAFDAYRGTDQDARLARVAAQVEGLGYQAAPGSSAVNARWTRVEDTVALIKMMGWKKIGIATCVGMLAETENLAEILRAQGLEPFSACCKTGSIDKLELGLKEDEKVRPGTFEAACNPIAQAHILNREGMEMNIIMGLCVGHDMLFAKHSQSPVTTLVVKDRVTGHNPISVLYGQYYYRRLRKQPVLEIDASAPLESEDNG